MMDFISIPVVVGIITLGIYKLFELFVRRRERLLMIEKMSAAPDQDLKPVTFSFTSNTNPSFGTLKIACLLLGVGLGLLVGFYIMSGSDLLVEGRDEWYINQTSGIIYGASVFLFGGLGLLVAFLIEHRLSEKNRK